MSNNTNINPPSSYYVKECFSMSVEAMKALCVFAAIILGALVVFGIPYAVVSIIIWLTTDTGGFSFLVGLFAIPVPIIICVFCTLCYACYDSCTGEIRDKYEKEVKQAIEAAENDGNDEEMSDV